MNAWRIRERILDVMEQTTGGRVIQGSCKIGGVRRDISNEKLDEMRRDLDIIEREIRDLTTVFLQDDSIKHRLRNVGRLSKEDAYHLGAVGPTARGSGVAIDLRKTGYGAYGRSTSSWSPTAVVTAMDAVRSGHRGSSRPSI